MENINEPYQTLVSLPRPAFSFNIGEDIKVFQRKLRNGPGQRDYRVARLLQPRIDCMHACVRRQERY